MPPPAASTRPGLPLRPFRLDLGDGEFVTGDELPGQRPSYVYLHGLASVRAGEKSSSLLAHAAASGRGCLRFDLRGHGESSGKLGRTLVSALIADVLAVLGHTGPAVLIGSSLGGLLGAHAAAARPDLVLGLALLAPALGLLGNLQSRLDPMGRMWTSEGQGFRVEPAVLADAAALDERLLPTRLRMPTLVVHGTADDVIPHRASERFFDALSTPRKDLWLVPGGDHRLNQFAEAIWLRLDRLCSNEPAR
jgi:pimeloyl-ACP methyl ester carboxylesterase